jgi:hypothetical protein
MLHAKVVTLVEGMLPHVGRRLGEPRRSSAGGFSYKANKV